MVKSRTVKVFTALLISMSGGALVLMVMETKPVHPQASLAILSESESTDAASVVLDTDVPLQPIKWRNIVIHVSPDGTGVAERCHFVLYPAVDGKRPTVVGTSLWKRQTEGHHLSVPGRDWNADSIGVCLVGDFSKNAPPMDQYRVLIDLVRTLRKYFRSIARDQVYLCRDLDSRTDSPGKAFPADDFWMRLRK